MIIKTVYTHSIAKKKEQYSETQEDTGDLGHDIQNEGCYKKYYNHFNACHSFLVNSYSAALLASVVTTLLLLSVQESYPHQRYSTMPRFV